MYNPDAPTGVGFFHWSLFNIPLESTTLESGAGAMTATTRPDGSATGALIRFSIKQHTLAEGTLTGKYGR